jgi:hypothetical protein
MSSEITSFKAFTVVKTDQINADDLISRSVTVQLGPCREYKDEKGGARLEFRTSAGKFWRPPPTIVRILEALWGDNPQDCVGRWVELFRDPDVRCPDGTIGGGVRIAAMSHIDRPAKVAVTIARGKKKMITVGVLKPPTEKAPTAAPDLATVLSGAGLTLADLDAWRAAQNKPPTADLNDAQRAQLAGWLMADPARLEALRPTPEDPTPDTAAPGWEE